ncbi:unnamed protein product [Phyllotreta striolata]|uniref:Helicase ATP-binding domain-containing protein n=1 Tax=Phyllotreta striolata TaxID=444603 RepID=A0A9N9XQR7_PHYSR|nr:unnamed protein product [Phyllotreta striolata]
MKKLYYTLENGKLGIFESPTGTGKSMSIICGAIKWLKDRQTAEKTDIIEQCSKLQQQKLNIPESTDWISMQSQKFKIDSEIMKLKQQESKIQQYEVKIQNIKKLKDNRLKTKLKYSNKTKNIETEDINNEPSDTEDDLLLNEAASKDETNSSEDENEDESSVYEPIKIYICSRTHSQLEQFLGEIRKSPFNNNIRVASLASRQTYCVNPSVSRLKNISLINERCLYMQKKEPKPKRTEDGKVLKKAKGSCTCPYYKKSTIEELSNYTLTEILDIEDLTQLGSTLEACPYYSSRKAAEDAEIVLVPYNTILHKHTREANGIKLNGNIVIIDEAHNLLESLTQMYNTELYYSQVYHASKQLKAYRDKFKSRFSSDNLLRINQVIYVVNKLLNMLERNSADGVEVLTISSFVVNAEIDLHNMFELSKFCKDSRLAQKTRSYVMKYPITEPKPEQKSGLEGVRAFLGSIKSNKDKTPTPQNPKETPKPVDVIPPVTNPLLPVISFFDCLACLYEDGRVIITKSSVKTDRKFQFLLLKPSQRFKDIVQQGTIKFNSLISFVIYNFPARSVIVAGGTMSPMNEFKNRLFINAGAPADRIVEFACDHIIPPQNILPIIVNKGAKNEGLLFNFEQRLTLINSIKNILMDVCKTVPGGVVVFFPSYDYENKVYQQLQGVDFGRELFREPKVSSKVDSLLEKYASTIKKPGSKGALLFSVVGGKLSEGLNFSDELGRCVIVIGMPYSNIGAVDLKEKMSYLDKTEGIGAGNKFYENQCMKAVNQCIGRAVRHRGDYAAMVLFDQRYARESTRSALPKWIQKSLKVAGHIEAIGLMEKFFQAKQED